MQRKVIQSEAAPAAIGPYSQAIVAGGFVFCSGQIPLDPASGQLVGDGNVARETEQVLENLKAVLNAAGSDLSRVVKTTVFLTDMNDFGAMNEVYGRYFSTEPPARAAGQVAALPKGVRVEIEAVAVVA